MDWESWKSEYGSSFRQGEHNARRSWDETRTRIRNHNEMFRRGMVSYRLRINQFAVEKPQGIRSIHEQEDFADSAEPSDDELGPAVTHQEPWGVGIDYRKSRYNMVTSVKEQVGGTCYAFAAVGVLEGQKAKKSGRLLRLSTQQLVDAKLFNIPSDCFRYAKKHGLATEKDYNRWRREGGDLTTCVKVKTVYKCEDEEKLKRVLRRYGPVAIGLDIPDDFDFIDNDTDIYDSNERSTGSHAVLLVGYGKTESGVRYWIIKNSWGTDWGGNGFARIKRGVGICGIVGWYATVRRSSHARHGSPHGRGHGSGYGRGHGGGY